MTAGLGNGLGQQRSPTFSRKSILGILVLILGIFLSNPSAFSSSRVLSNTSFKNKTKSRTTELIDYLVENPIRDVRFEIPVFLTSIDKFKFPDLAEATQVQLDHEIDRMNLAVNYGFKLFNNPSFDAFKSKYTGHVSRYFNASPFDGEHVFNNKLKEENILDIKLLLGDAEGIYSDMFENFAVLYFTKDSINTNDLPYFVTQTILANVFDDEISIFNGDYLVQTIDELFDFSISTKRDSQGASVPETELQEIYFNFVILLDDEIITLDIRVRDLITYYLSVLNEIFKGVYIFDFNLVVEKISEYSEKNSKVWTYNNVTCEFNLNPSNSEVLNLSQDASDSDLRDANFEAKKDKRSVRIKDYQNFNFLLCVPGTSQKLKIRTEGQSSAESNQENRIFKSPHNKSVYVIQSLQLTSNDNMKREHGSADSTHEFYLLEHDEFKATFETLLTKLYKVLAHLYKPSTPTSSSGTQSQVELKTITRIDVLTRAAIIKNFYKIARSLSKLKEKVLDSDAFSSPYQTQLRKAVVEAVNLRNSAVELVNSNVRFDLQDENCGSGLQREDYKIRMARALNALLIADRKLQGFLKAER